MTIFALFFLYFYAWHAKQRLLGMVAVLDALLARGKAFPHMLNCCFASTN